MAKKEKLKARPRLRFPEFREKGDLYETTIGEISNQITAGATPDTSDKSYWNGAHRWMNSGELNYKRVYKVQGRITDQGLNNSSTKILPEQCVLIGLAGQGKTRGTVAMNMVPLCTNQSIAAIFPNKSVFESDFLYHNLDNRYEELRSLSAGGEGRGGLNLQIIRSLKILLPPLPEQKKIADCLSSLDELIAAQCRKVEALKAHKRGLLQELFPREGETIPRLRFPEFRDGPEWEEDTLAQVAKFRRGSFPQPYGLPEWYDEDNGIPFVQVFDVSDDLRLKEKTKSKISKLGSEQSVFIPKGTLIVTLQGSIGRVAITQYDAYVDRTLLIFEEFIKPIDKIYFAYIIQNLFEIEKEKAPGGIIKTITKEALSDFKVKLPDLLEQQRIASCLSSLGALVAAESEKLEALKTHKKGLMQQLFPALEEVGE